MPLLETHPFFSLLKTELGSLDDMRFIVNEVLNEELAEKGEAVFSTKETAQRFYFLTLGGIEYRRTGQMGSIELMAANWLAEASLWLQWKHVGTAASICESFFVTVEAKEFRRVLADSPIARQYAHLFHKLISESQFLCDIMLDERERMKRALRRLSHASVHPDVCL